MKKPTIGRMVIYWPTEEEIELMRQNPDMNVVTQMPATVVNVWSDEVINLRVHIDGAGSDWWKTSVQKGADQGEWSWPEIEIKNKDFSLTARYFLGTKIILGERTEEENYQVGYFHKPLENLETPDYTSFSPADVFEDAYFPIDTPEHISKDDVERFIKKVESTTVKGNITVTTATLINGFTITESSSPVNISQYDEKIGEEINMKKIEDKVWFLLGFLLKSALFGVKK